jgi:hypothetical protein
MYEIRQNELKLILLHNNKKPRKITFLFLKEIIYKNVGLAFIRQIQN